jgi:phage-related protein
MSTYQAATAGIRLVPILPGFHREAKAKIEAKPLKATVQLVPELSANFAAEAAAKLARVRATLPVQMVPDFTGFSSALRAKLAAESVPRVAIGLHVTNDEIARFIAYVRAKLAAANVRLPITLQLVDEAGFQARVAALTRDRTMNVNVDINRSALSQVGKLFRGIGSIVKTVAPFAAIGVAAAGAIGPLGALAAALTTAAGAMAVLPAFAVAAGAGIAAIAIGANGIGDAFSALSQAGSAAADTSKAVESAQQRVASAERGIETAQRNAERAQERLNDARKDAAKRLRDMNDELKNSALDEESAALAVERARERLDETNRDPKASALDRKEADLNLRQAVAALDQQRKANNDLSHETALANQAGIEGSREVIDAKQDVADATQSQVDAQQDLSNALRDLADAGKGAGGVDKFAEAMAKLAPNAQEFVRAMQALGPAWTETRKFIQDNLFEGLGDSFTKLANTQLPVLKEGLGGIATELNRGLRGALAQFSTETAALDFSKTLGNSTKLFSGIADSMAPISQAFMDITTVGSEFLGGAGEGISSWATQFADSIAEMRADGSLKEMMQNGIDMAKQFGAVLADVGGIIGGVFRAATDAGGGAVGGISTILDKLHEFVDSTQGQTALKSFFTSINEIIGALLPVFLQLANIIGTVVAPALADLITGLGPGLTDLVAGFGAGLAALAPVMGPLGQAIGSIGTALAPVMEVLGQAMGDAITALLPAIQPLAETFGAFVEVLAPLLPLIGDLIGTLLPPLAEMFTTVFTALGPVITMLVEGFRPILDTLAPILGEVATMIGDALAQAITALAPLLPPIMEAFGALVAAVVPLIPPIVEIAVNLIPIFVDVLAAVLPAVTTVIEILTKLVEFIVPILIPVIETIGSIVGSVFGAVGDVISGTVTNVIQPILDTLKSALEGVGGFFTDVGETIGNAWDNIVSGIAIAVKAIGQILQKVEIPDWVPGIGGKGLTGLGDSMVAWADQHLAEGGQVNAGRTASGLLYGPGNGTSDTIVGLNAAGVPTAMVSPGEWVTPEQAVNDRTIPVLEALRHGWVPSADFLHRMLPGFAAGGKVGEPLAPWPGGGGEDNLKPSAIVARRLIHQLWPEITEIGGYRASDPYPDHPSGRALDIMTGNEPLGTSIKDWLHQNKTPLALNYTIWQQYYQPADGAGNLMEDRGSATQNHLDHIHALFNPSDVDPNVIPPGVQIPGASTPPATPTQPTTPMAPPVSSSPSSSSSKTPSSSSADSSGKVPTVGDIAADAARESVDGVFEFFGLKDTVFYDPNKSLFVRGAMAATTPVDQLPSTTSPSADVQVTPDVSKPEAPIVYNPALGAVQWRPLIDKALQLMGSPLTNGQRTQDQVDIESSGNPEAVNNTDINAQNGTPSKGLLQVIQPTFDAMVHPSLKDRSLTDPLANLTAGIGWVINRWGGPEKKWPTRAGYRDGGWVLGAGTGTSDSIPIDASNNEFVVRAAKAQRYGSVLEAINSGQMDQAVAQIGRSRAEVGATGPAEVHQHFGEINTFSQPAAVREYRREMHVASLSDSIAGG